MKQVSKSYADNYSAKIQRKMLWNIMVIKAYFKEHYGIEESQLNKILSRCSYYQYGKIKNLTETELKVYDYFNHIRLRPQTAYKWYLASRLPEELKDKLGRSISPTKAIKMARNRELNQQIALSHELMNDIRKVLREVI